MAEYGAMPTQEEMAEQARKQRIQRELQQIEALKQKPAIPSSGAGYVNTAPLQEQQGQAEALRDPCAGLEGRALQECTAGMAPDAGRTYFGQ